MALLLPFCSGGCWPGEGILKCTSFVEMSQPPPRPPFTPLPGPNTNLQIHTVEDGTQWVDIGGQWLRAPSQMDVDSPRRPANPYPVTNTASNPRPPRPGADSARFFYATGIFYTFGSSSLRLIISHPQLCRCLDVSHP
ncbi:hypothetical protein B0H13DRAFT_1851569 [Mycena leptocephala]|nr:hypothetical protein B0H13DRAFT_1851569 [Mycena leptocephala]